MKKNKHFHRAMCQQIFTEIQQVICDMMVSANTKVAITAMCKCIKSTPVHLKFTQQYVSPHLNKAGEGWGAGKILQGLSKKHKCIKN